MTLEYYKAYDQKRNRISFLLAHSLEEAKQSYKRNHGVDPETVEWEHNPFPLVTEESYKKVD